MKDQEIVDLLHIEIHGLRLQPNYKPSLFEQKMNKLIAEEFQHDCKECKHKHEQLKYQQPQQKKGILGGLFK